MTHERKGAAPVRGTEVLENLADEIYPAALGLFASAVEGSLAYNLVCTNVPGPSFPLYLLGARMTDSFPLVPLFGHQGVGIALLSYAGKLCWGFSADRDIVPDLHDLVEDVDRRDRVRQLDLHLLQRAGEGDRALVAVGS